MGSIREGETHLFKRSKNINKMIKLKVKEREETLNEMVEIAAETYGISKEQAQKRVNALEQAIDAGMFDGIPESGPSDFMQAMFVQVKTDQIMNTPIKD